MSIIAPLRGSPFVDNKGVPLSRVMQWIESVTDAVKPGDVQSKTSAYTLLTSDAGVTCDASGGDFTVTLPDATKLKGREYFVQNAGTSGTVNIVASSGDGTNWVLLGFIGDGTTVLNEFWVTDSGESIVDENGEELIFAI